MNKSQKWSASVALAAYAAFVVIFREQAESALSQVLATIGAVL